MCERPALVPQVPACPENFKCLCKTPAKKKAGGNCEKSARCESACLCVVSENSARLPRVNAVVEFAESLSPSVAFFATDITFGAFSAHNPIPRNFANGLCDSPAIRASL